MKEELIKFETAKLAKEKGFDEMCQYLYSTLKGREGQLLPELSGTMGQSNRILVPTQSFLQKWIREKYDIHVNPQPYHETADHTNDITGYYMGDIEHGARGKILYVGDDNYSTYEEALEAGLLKALKEINL